MNSNIFSGLFKKQCHSRIKPNWSDMVLRFYLSNAPELEIEPIKNIKESKLEKNQGNRALTP
jgi:hypothetical protein